MSVELRELTYENFHTAVELKVRADQQQFIESNAYYIAQSKVDQEVTPLTVYADGEMVGFLVHGIDEDDGRVWLMRLMIDQRFQGRGYARAAVVALVQRIQQTYPVDGIYLRFPSGNERAYRLYTGLGWTPTGDQEEGQDIYVLHVGSGVWQPPEMSADQG